MSQIVEQIPAFPSSTNLIREVEKVSRNFLSRKIILIRTGRSVYHKTLISSNTSQYNLPLPIIKPETCYIFPEL